MHVELAAHQEAHRGGKLGLGLQHLRGLLLDDEGAAGDRRRTLRGMRTSGENGIKMNQILT